jgi:hypothetical protein
MTSKRALLVASILLAAAVVPSALPEQTEAKPCNPGHPCPSPSPSPTPSGDPVITAAGDIADPVPKPATQETAKLVISINPTLALTLGDNQYPSGLLSDYQKGYASTWGAFLAKTSPAPGNHEYKSSSTAAGYFAYFGSRAPSAYYSYNVGAWHLISLDSNCSKIGGCGLSSPQYNWLKADLAAHPATCTLAYWHHPRWSSGTTHGGSTSMSRFWNLLYGAGADVVLSGHEHNYERFAPQDPSGGLDTARGIVQIVVGVGGHGLYPFGAPKPNSLVRNSSTFGVLKLTLHPSSYDFEFRPIAGSTFSDRGTTNCH